jgi:RNA polymerase sigma-70 factor (ECF subfamily)
MELTLAMGVEVWESIWKRHADRLLLYAATLLGDRAQAEDTLQNVFVRLIAGGAPPDFEFESAYLFRAVRNEALNALRSRRAAARSLPPLFEETGDPRLAAELAETGRQVEQALRRLSDEEREAVVLKIWGDLSFPEAAGVLGVPEKTIEHRYYRGLAALKEALGGSHE